jgi:hypothetical protein
MKHLNDSKKRRLTLSAGNLCCIKWHVDASFAVHPDFKSHTSATMSFEGGKGTAQSASRKQKLNTKSSTEAELFWSRRHVCHDALDQTVLGSTRPWDRQNTSYVRMTRVLFCWKKMVRRAPVREPEHWTFVLSFLTDQVEKTNVIIKHCPTNDVIGDFHAKPPQGEKFRVFHDSILGP